MPLQKLKSSDKENKEKLEEAQKKLVKEETSESSEKKGAVEELDIIMRHK